MTSLLTPRRTTPGLSLQAGDAGPTPTPDPVDTAGGPPLGWPVAAVAGGLLTALAGWVLCAGLAVVGWLAAEPGTLSGALVTGTRLWLLANGVGTRIGGLPVTLVPWGATAVIAYMTAWFTGVAARRVRPDQLAGRFTVSAVLLVAYLLPVLGAAVWLGQPWRAPLHWATVIAGLGLAATVGAGRALGRRLTDGWPAWARSLPQAVLAAQLVLLVAGAALVVTGLLRHLDRVRDLQEALDPGVAGGIVLLLAQLAFVPNAVVWASAYALGAGFAAGTGSVVAPTATELGLLPGVPLLGALPASGPGDPVLLGWLAAGAAAGAVAALVVGRSHPGLRLDAGSLVGGLAGVLAAGMFVGLAWASSGDLGAGRLVALGPRLVPLLVLAGSTLGLAGLLTGLAVGVVRLVHLRRRRRRPPEDDSGAETSG